MDGGAGTRDGPPCPSAGAETGGGFRVGGPKSGNGTQSPVYYLGSAGFGPPRPRPPALRKTNPPASDPMTFEPDQRTDEGWRGAGGRWLLWPLRVLLWAALLIIAFR